MKFAIVERGDAYSKELADYIKERCQQEGWQYHKSNPDLIISIGGDGTMLRSIHEYLDQLDSVCFVGIHTGTLGFLTDYTKQEIHLFLHGLFNKKLLFLRLSRSDKQSGKSKNLRFLAELGAAPQRSPPHGA